MKTRLPLPGFGKSLVAASTLAMLALAWITLAPPASQAASDDFYMAIMSDPQIDWACQWCSDTGGPLPASTGGTKSNEKHAASIDKLVDQVGQDKFEGIIINGDIIAFGWGPELAVEAGSRNIALQESRL